MKNIIVSLVIPIYNEEKYITKCLETILNQNFDIDLVEILLVDGESRDKTCEIINEFQKNNKNIILLKNAEKITPKSMNIGIKNAKGKYIFIMSAHVEYDSNYISKCIEYLEKTGADNVGGPVRPKSTGYLGEINSLLHKSKFGIGVGKHHNEKYEGYVDTVFLGAYRREIFDRIGVFNEKLIRNQDIELNSRLINSGGKIYMTPEIKTYYFNRNTLIGLCNQNYDNGKWNIYTAKLCKNSLHLRHFVPLVFVASLIISGILGNYNEYMKYLFYCVIGSYAICDIFFSIQASIKYGIRYLVMLPISFFMLHISYGVGSLIGILITFWKPI